MRDAGDGVPLGANDLEAAILGGAILGGGGGGSMADGMRLGRAAFACDTALPLTSAELALGRDVILLKAPAARLILGAGLREPANYRQLENAVGRPIVKYAFRGSQ